MSLWSLYVNRSIHVFRETARKIIYMEGVNRPDRSPKNLLTFNSQQDINEVVTGCDADIGGLSTVNFDLVTDKAINDPIGKLATGLFWGDMRLAVKPQVQGTMRGGYAGFRNRQRPTLFGDIVEDVAHHQYLALRVRAAGSPRTRNSYFVNILTDTPITTDVWQHRLFFRKSDGSWEDIFIPFNSFVLTNTGQIVNEEVEMFRERIRSVGISMLGGNSGVEGHYELGIDSIRAVNEEDIVFPSEKEPSYGTRWERGAV